MTRNQFLSTIAAMVSASFIRKHTDQEKLASIRDRIKKGPLYKIKVGNVTTVAFSPKRITSRIKVDPRLEI